MQGGVVETERGFWSAQHQLIHHHLPVPCSKIVQHQLMLSPDSAVDPVPVTSLCMQWPILLPQVAFHISWAPGSTLPEQS